MNDLIRELDFEATVRDYDFTRRAMQGMSGVLNSDDFEEMDVNRMFHFLMSEMEIVSFKDYLKRYIYERAGIGEPFSTVPDEVYRDIIMDSFEENYAPHSFTPTTRKWSATVRGWLTQENARRSSVFLLGFGLRMTAKDVSGFLTKVLKEEDFVFDDVDEVIYWYCFANQFPYTKARELQKLYEMMAPSAVPEDFQVLVRNLPQHDTFDLSRKEDFHRYLSWLKMTGAREGRRQTAYEIFDSYYDRSRETVAAIYRQDEEEIRGTRLWTKEDVTSADLERFICSGIPVNKSGNLQKMSASILSRQFMQRRMSRQRLDSLCKRQLPVERFDLITLLFFVYSQNESWEDPTDRAGAYVDEINAALTKCGMMEIYPANPYEAFVLMCLLSELPLAVYSEVWELSYSQDAAAAKGSAAYGKTR